MKVILEAADLIRILGAHFGAEFDPENVTIKTDPFEVEVRGIPLPEAEKATLPAARVEGSPRIQRPDPETLYVPRNSAEEAELVARRADGDASVDPPEPGTDDSDAMSASGSPLSLIEQSKKLEAELERDRPRRRKGGSDRAPTNFQDEVT